MSQASLLPRSADSLEASVAIAWAKGRYFSIAMEPIATGALIYTLIGRVFATPTRCSVQLGPDCHIDADSEGSLEDSFDLYPYRFTNHACEPNMALRDGSFYASSAIHRGDELTFNYNASEYDLAEPFECECGARSCGGLIRGFRYLSAADRERLRPLRPRTLR